MKSLRNVTSALAVACALYAAPNAAQAASQAPTLARVDTRVSGDVARFTLWYADPAQSWASTLNQRNGWMVVLLLLPNGKAGTMYEVDGTGLYNGSLPVYEMQGSAPYAYQPPMETTPVAGQAPLQLRTSGLTLDVPVSALNGSARGMRYEVHVYSMVAVDDLLGRLDEAGSYAGQLDGALNASLSPTSTDGTTWGALRARYR